MQSSLLQICIELRSTPSELITANAQRSQLSENHQDVRKPPTVRWGVFKKIRRRPTLPGGDLQVPSAQVGLTAVFEMGTGVTPPPKPPETYAYVTLVTGSLILKRFIASTNIYNSKPSAD